MGANPHASQNPNGTAIPAAAYVRMSTEHQQYSTENQLDRIKEYAARRGMTIVRVFEDAGKSGLNVRGRESLRQMIAEVEGGTTEFKSILAYDVSRWGRFQDADESGYYEYICKRAGITVHYCAEQFENDGSPTSNIIKSVKRSMAGEYSRELSTKVFQGACRLIQMGFKQGGTAGYGLRRMLVDQSGKTKGVLAFGEHKSLQTDRVVLTLGPDDEVETVRGVYREFLEEKLTESEIADQLNAKGIKTDLGREWTRGTVHQLLTNEKYLGNNVYHRTSFKLKKTHVQNPSDMWIRVPGAFPAIVSQEDFLRVQEIIIARAKRYTDEEMLEKLREVLRQHGRISGVIIDEREDLPLSSAFRSRFGSLVRAYQLIGYTPDTDFGFIEVNRYVRALLVGTGRDHMVDADSPKKVRGMPAEDLARMEREMETLERDYKMFEERYGENALHLNAAQRYVRRLMDNAKVKRFLTQRHPEILEELQELAALESL